MNEVCTHPPVFVLTPARHDNKAVSNPLSDVQSPLGKARHAHATELQGLHLFQLSKIVVLSPPGSWRLAPTLELLPGGACVVRVLYQTRL